MNLEHNRYSTTRRKGRLGISGVPKNKPATAYHKPLSMGKEQNKSQNSNAT